MSESARIARLEKQLTLLAQQVGVLKEQLAGSKHHVRALPTSQDFIEYREAIKRAARGDRRPLYEYLERGGAIPGAGGKESDAT